MPARISVLIPVHGTEPDLVGLVESLDAQTLPYREFEVVFVLDDAGSGWAARLGDLAQHRPHIRVVVAEEGDPDATATALGDAGVEHVLLLDSALLAEGVVLLPEALQRLTDFAAGHGCDVVLARVVRPDETSTPRLFVADRPALGSDERQLGTTSLLLVTRELLGKVGGNPDDLLGADTIGVLGSYPAARLSGPEPAAGTASLEQPACDLSWTDGVLTISAHAQLPSGRSVSDGRLWLRDRSSLVEFWLPLESHDSSEGTVRFTARVDVRTAADGQPLPDGVWLCGLALALDDDQVLSRVALPATTAPNALLAGRPVVTADVGGQLGLDVGARRHALVGRFGPDQVTFEESARGTLLTARLPEIVTYGSARVAGGLLLGKMRLPAELVAEEGRDTELRCYVSGLAGTSTLATQFFGPRPSRSGVALSISEVGIMSAVLPELDEPTPPAPFKSRPKAKAAKAATSSPAADAPAERATEPSRPVASSPNAPVTKTPTATGARSRLVSVAKPVVRQIRRSVPAPLEPAVKALSRQPLARDLYRKLAGIKPPRK